MRLLNAIILSFFICMIACKSPNGQNNNQQNNDNHGDHEYTNHLIHESSPYLLQHAHNPVDWYPWGDEALAKAKKEDKMLLISIGYAACHWCHVMEHESFEDTTVSKIMNDNFVCIKIDREERPDIDDVYMTACHMSTGKSCGWPLNSFALPDGRPVWAGTYFPKKKWMEILTYFVAERKKDPEKMEEYAEQLTQGIQGRDKITINGSDQVFVKSELDNIVKNFLQNIDFKRGGRKGAPKFPMPNNFQFLLNYHYLYKDTKSLEAVTKTLDEMAYGGIYDQLGGGFARYSTDDKWLVPHFEKMTYDNGQLVSLYAQAYQMTKKPLYKKVIEETLAYTKREMTHKNGGFYSSLDADSEGEEGKFYVWTKEEIDAVTGDETTSKIYNDYYNINSKGNWEEHKNILHLTKTPAQIAKKHKLTEEALATLIQSVNVKLMAARDKRVRPGLDDKILTSWNALMLKGYIDAYRALGDPSYLDIALKNANFIVKEMIQEDGRLNRNFKNEKSVINAFLDDYALTIDAFTNLYQVTFDEQWLYKSKELADYAISHFFDKESAMFNYTSDIDPPLVARKMELTDNVIPGSNSSMARALYQLGTYLYNSDYIDKSKQMAHNMTETLTQTETPNFYSNWCSLYTTLVNPPYEIAIVGDDHNQLRKEMLQYFLPNALLLGGKDEGSLELLTSKLQEGETMIYVCQNKVCKFPVREVDKAIELMN